MSMYALVFGDRSDAGAVVLSLLGVPPGHRVEFVGRFRDAWIEKAPGSDGPPILVLYTRNGGGNRADYADEIARMRAHPNYLRDADDSFDSTYAAFYFSLPEEAIDPDLVSDWKEVRAACVEAAVDPIDTDQRWHNAIAAVQNARLT